LTPSDDYIARACSRHDLSFLNRHPVNTTTLDYLDDMSTSSGAPESWISSFCSLLGHEYFAEVSEEFIEDDFNLTGLQNQVAMYKEALEMILDVEPEEDEDEEEEEEEDEEDNDSGDQDRLGPRHDRRQHSRMASDLSVIESSSEMLYGLIHQRFICSRAGIQQMSEKYELGHFGCCPRTNCDQARTLPVGLSDIPGEDTVKLFCPSCLDVYVPPNSRFQTVDGAFFGRTFGALFLLTFPEYDLTKRGAEVLSSGGARINDDSVEMINGMYAKNIAPGLGAGRIYEPRIYGFRVSEIAKSGPRMQWLRDRPDDMTELDEARLYADEHPDSDEEDESMNGNGRPAPRRPAPRGNARLRAQRQAQNGSPMNVETNGAESEL
ncbi:casein kinase ii regulatory subunit, partial [Colletotrichum incanum]